MAAGLEYRRLANASHVRRHCDDACLAPAVQIARRSQACFDRIIHQQVWCSMNNRIVKAFPFANRIFHVSVTPLSIPAYLAAIAAAEAFGAVASGIPSMIVDA